MSNFNSFVVSLDLEGLNWFCEIWTGYDIDKKAGSYYLTYLGLLLGVPFWLLSKWEKFSVIFGDDRGKDFKYLVVGCDKIFMIVRVLVCACVVIAYLLS